MFATLLGDPALVNRQSELYAAVTVDRVNEFVRKFLVEDNRAKLLFVPRAGAEEAGDAQVFAAAAS